MLSRMTCRRCVFIPLPEKGAQQQQMLERKPKGMHAGKRPEEKDKTSANVVSAEE